MTETCSPSFSQAWPAGFGEALGQGKGAKLGIVVIWNLLLESWGRMGEQEEESWFPPSSEDIGRHICMHIWLLEMSEIGMSQSE